MDDLIKKELDGIEREFKQWAQSNVSSGNPHPGTIHAYWKDTEEHLVWLVDEDLAGLDENHRLTIQVVRHSDFRRYLEHLATNNNQSENTVQRKAASLKCFYSMASETGVTSENWMKTFRVPSTLALKHKEQALTADQVSLLLGSPNVNTPDGKRDKAILALMTMHGLEVNEVHKLNLDNIQLDQGKAGVIHVVGRGDKIRDIALSTKSSDLLQAWLEERRRWLNEADPHRDDGPVFLAMHFGTRGKSGQRVSERGIRGIVDGYLEAVEAKREGISCHALRHNYIVLSLQGGSESLQELIESIEHGSVSTTCVYPT